MSAHLLLLPLSLASATPESLALWSDGRAELDGYRLVQPRYGELHKGTAVLIFVKEDFSESARVKADPGVHPASDVFPVMKLNVVKHFQTGIYDYNLMTSAFVAFEPSRAHPENAVVKIAFSNQEWCGTVFEELLFDPRSIHQKRFSYFDKEADLEQTLANQEGGLIVDALPLAVRQIAETRFESGASKETMILPSLERTRLLHRRLEWKKGRIARSKEVKREATPLGEIEVETWTIEVGDGDRYEYDVEHAAPRRLIAWRGPDQETGQLLGSTRLKYWELHNNGDEKWLSQIGLPPPR
jgi:hypothetical protein